MKVEQAVTLSQDKAKKQHQLMLLQTMMDNKIEVKVGDMKPRPPQLAIQHSGEILVNEFLSQQKLTTKTSASHEAERQQSQEREAYRDELDRDAFLTEPKQGERIKQKANKKRGVSEKRPPLGKKLKKKEYVLDDNNKTYKILEHKDLVTSMEKKKKMQEQLELFNFNKERQLILSQAFRQPDEEMHYYIETFGNNAHMRGDIRKMVPLQKGIVKVGNEIIGIEKFKYPTHENEQPKRLKISKFNDEEMQVMCSKDFYKEREEWKLILANKEKQLNVLTENVRRPKTNNQMFKFV